MLYQPGISFSRYYEKSKFLISFEKEFGPQNFPVFIKPLFFSEELLEIS